MDEFGPQRDALIKKYAKTTRGVIYEKDERNKENYKSYF